MKAAVLSDLHLDYVNENDFESFINFLNQAREIYDLLIINGDALDSPASTSDFSGRMLRVVETVSDFVKAERKVIYLIGNHDIGITAFVGNYESFGFEIRYPSFQFKLGDRFVYLEHGHSCDPFYRTHLYDVLKIVESETGFEIGENVVRLLEETARVLQLPQKDGFGVPAPALKIWEREAEKKIKEGIDIVCMGHTHEPTLKKIRKGIYANSGCWPQKRTFLELTEGEISLMNYAHNSPQPVKKLSF